MDVPFLLAREYPSSLIISAFATFAAFIVMAGTHRYPGRLPFTGLMASFPGMIFGGVLAIAYLFTQIGGWAILMAPGLLIAVGLAALGSGIALGLVGWVFTQLFAPPSGKQYPVDRG